MLKSEWEEAYEAEKRMQQNPLPAIAGAEARAYVRFNDRGMPLTQTVNPIEYEYKPKGFQLGVILSYDPSLTERCPWTVLLANSKGDLAEKKPNIALADSDEVSVDYSRNVPVIYSRTYDCFTTMGADNNLHFVGIDSTGHIQVWQVAVVSQHGEYFATLQKLFEYSAIWNDEEGFVEFPGVEWPQLKEWLAKQFIDWRQGPEEDGVLPEAISAEDTSMEDELEDEAEDVGVVVFYNLARGMGVIKMKNGVIARVHWTQLNELRYLFAGELVKVRELVDAEKIQGIYSDRKTNFKWEARGVTLIEQAVEAA